MLTAGIWNARQKWIPPPPRFRLRQNVCAAQARRPAVRAPASVCIFSVNMSHVAADSISFAAIFLTYGKISIWTAPLQAEIDRYREAVFLDYPLLLFCLNICKRFKTIFFIINNFLLHNLSNSINIYFKSLVLLAFSLFFPYAARDYLYSLENVCG